LFISFYFVFLKYNSDNDVNGFCLVGCQANLAGSYV